MEWMDVLTNSQHNRMLEKSITVLKQFIEWLKNRKTDEEVVIAWAPGNWYLAVRNGELYLKIDKSVSVDREPKPGEPPKPLYDYEKITLENQEDVIVSFRITLALLEEAKKKIENVLAKKKKAGLSNKLSPEDWQRIFEEFEKLLRSSAIPDLKRWVQLGDNPTHVLILTERGLLKVDKNTPITKRGQEANLVGKIDIADWIDEFNLKAEALAEIRRQLEA